MTKRSSRKLIYCLVAIVAFLALAPTLLNGFVNWDDPQAVLRNPFIRDFSIAGAGRLFAAFPGNYYAPLVFLSYSVDYFFFRLNPFPYHFADILLHALNSLLALALVFSLARDFRLAAAAALIFAAHPLHVESVAWVTERKDLLYSFFFLAALLLYRRGSEPGSFSRVSLAASLLCFACSLLSKPSAVILPAVLLIGVGWRQNQRMRIVLTRLIPYFALAALYLLLMWRCWPGAKGVIRGNYRAPATYYLALGTRNIVLYFWKIVFPVNLSAFYPLPPLNNLFAPAWIIPAIALMTLITVIVRFRRFHPLSAGAIFYLIALLPVLQWIPSGNAAAADRFAYLPLLGIAVAGAGVGGAAARANGGALRTYLHRACFAAILVLFGLGAACRCRVWRDGETLWSSVIRRYPESPEGHLHLASFHLENGNPKQALEEAKRTLAIDPGLVKAHVDRAEALRLLGRREEAIAGLLRATRIFPNEAKPHTNLGFIYGVAGRLPEARAALLRSLALDPGGAEAYNNLGIVQELAGEWAAAERSYRAALGFDPLLSEARLNLLRVGEKMRRQGEATFPGW